MQFYLLFVIVILSVIWTDMCSYSTRFYWCARLGCVHFTFRWNFV